MSSRTIVYKGMFLAYQLGAYYPDLHDPRFASQMALVHQRFSTNTFPSWKLAHPYRMVAHNGEINTLRGNVNWMAARQASVSSPLFGDEISKLWPISYEGQSDTACFDNALEFLTMGGYELAHAAMMLIPEAWAGNPLMDEDRRAFYEYNAALMEPWDGPAAIAFTDGRQIAATLDRNGLRPARYVVTDDGLVIMASEVGVLPVPAEKIVTKWRLQPGKMLLIDLEAGRIVSDDELKRRLATANPYRQWLAKTQIVLEDLPAVARAPPRPTRRCSIASRPSATAQEDLKLLMAPMATTGQEAVGSMGTDTPVAVLSRKPKVLYNYFKQNFAQVTNPAIDPIREEAVMSLVSFIGPRPNLFDLKGASERKRLEVRQPILTNEDLEKIRMIGDIADNHFQTQTLDITYAVGARRGRHGHGRRRGSASRAERAVLDGYNIIILSDRLLGAGRVAIPALLATAAVHNHLIRKGLRTSVGLVVETGEAREVHHFCVLAGYGAEAINPYLAFETLLDMHAEGAFPEVVEARRGRLPLHQVDRQGRAEGHVQDGHLDLSVLLRRADFRRDRPLLRLRAPLLLRHLDHHRGRRPRRDRRGDDAPAPGGLRRGSGASPRARCRRRLRLPPARRGSHVDAGSGRAPPARGARQGRRDLSAIRRPAERRRCSGTSPSAASSASRPPKSSGARRCRSRRSSRRPRS